MYCTYCVGIFKISGPNPMCLSQIALVRGGWNLSKVTNWISSLQPTSSLVYSVCKFKTLFCRVLFSPILLRFRDISIKAIAVRWPWEQAAHDIEASTRALTFDPLILRLGNAILALLVQWIQVADTGNVNGWLLKKNEPEGRVVSLCRAQNCWGYAHFRSNLRSFPVTWGPCSILLNLWLDWERR